jgi:hypothetical protein
MTNLVFTPTLYPPIGHTTTCYVERGIVEFHCLMELSCDEGVVPSLELLQPGRHFTVLLWWSVEGRGEWNPAAFGRDEETNGGTTLQVWPGEFRPSILLNALTALLQRQSQYETL